MWTLYFAAMVYIFFFFFLLSSFFFFFSPILSGRKLNVYHTSTIHNLECRSEMCCTRFAKSTGRKKSPSAHHRTTLSSYILATKARIDNRKKINSYVFFTIHMPHNVVNFGSLTTKTVSEFGPPQQTSTGFASWLCYCTDVAQRRSTKLCTIFGRLLGWYTVYIHFPGRLTLNGILPAAKFTLRPTFVCSPILAALLHSTQTVGVSQTVRRATRNRITELSQRAPPIFGRAAITLGIGSNCSFLLVLSVLL